MTTPSKKSWIVYLSTFPPRECGIATFTDDLANYFNQLFAPAIESKVIAMNLDEVSRFHYPKKVIDYIAQNNRDQYKKMAEKLNALQQVKLVSIQHEFGIFGGEWGDFLIDFVTALTKPLVITFHTVLPSPDKKLLQVVKDLATSASKISVMTNLSKKILTSDYGISESKITIIPHGIHPVPYSLPKSHKAALGLSDKIVLTNFGLLSRGKGLEYAIEALPEVVKKFPSVRFLILGATHPVILKQEGETYRNSLKKRVYDLGLSNYVRFYDEYLSTDELLGYLQATDIYIATSQSPNQAVSGTLSYALGTGRPVISTSFAQAKEDVTEKTGRLVGFGESQGITTALLELLANEELRSTMGKTAYIKARNMTWPNVAIAYMRMFTSLAPELKTEEKHLPKIKLSHFVRMTDEFAFFQFAELAEPDPRYGYTVDDNARALIAVAQYHQKFKSPLALRLFAVYLSFLEYTFDTKTGYFRNYVNFDKSFNEKANTTEGMEDPTSRALYGLAVAATTKSIPRALRLRAQKLFEDAVAKNIDLKYPRSRAFFIKALAAWLSLGPNASLEKKLKENCDILVSLYEKNAVDSTWQWFEDALTYSNGLLSEALLTGFHITKNLRYLEVAKFTLEFLIAHTFENGMYVPIGHLGWFKRGQSRAYYFQQPEDPAATVLALHMMHKVTGIERYRRLQQTAFSWFLGNNSLGQVVYDQATGGSYDGVRENNLNLNEGAESTISYLLARLAMQS